MRMHTVGVGQTPMAIAALYGVGLGELVAANPHKVTVNVGNVKTFATLGVGEALSLPRGVGQADKPCCEGCADKVTEGSGWWRGGGLSGGPGKLGAFSGDYQGGVMVPAAEAEAACTGRWSIPGNWPHEMTVLSEEINASGPNQGERNYAFYKGRLYKFTSDGGNTTLATCSSLPANWTPGTPGPGPNPDPGNTLPPLPKGDPGGIKKVGLTDGASSSSVTPILIGVAALAAGIGLAYMVREKHPTAHPAHAPAHRRLAFRRRR